MLRDPANLLLELGPHLFAFAADLAGPLTDVDLRLSKPITLPTHWSPEQAAAVFDSTQEGVLVTDPSQHIVHVNPAFSRITGYSTEEVLGQTPRLFASGKHDAAFYNQMWLALREHGEWSGEIWNRRKNGEVYPQWQNLRCIHDNQGQLSHYVAVFSDLSALKRSREELDQLAHYDPLLKLPNRLLFTERAKQDLERARANRRSGALLLIDLDHFKDINESLGHSLGDALLQAVSTRLGEYLEEGMTLGRLGGDEFARARVSSAQLAGRRIFCDGG